jgi:Protein kinase domain
MPEFAPGDVFVNHRIEGLAGRGGMGVVYRAIDLDLDRVVALKVIAPALAEEPDFRARFVAESKAAASIEHPHVIPVYYAGEREGVLFIVMRYVDGPDLRALVRAEGSLDAERAAHIVAQIGDALDAAHAHGLVHRDVKPANVLLGVGDHAYLTDFGLTKRAASTAALSRPGAWVGTLGFVAPEQIRGERVDARTDVYALGCVLVHALSGGAPYIRESDEATLWAHLHAAPPTDLVPTEFAGIVERALSKDPADRFPSAGDLGRAALAAAGRSVVPAAERNVARGAAAPEGTPQTAATARASVPAHEGETHDSPPADGATAVTAIGRGLVAALARRRGATLAGAGLLIAAGVLAATLTTGGDGGSPVRRSTATGTAPRTPPAPRKAVADPPIPGLTRPNALTIAAGKVWILSNQSGQLEVLDARSGKPAPGRRLNIGAGGNSVAGGFGSVWVVKGRTRSLLRINAKTRRRVAASTHDVQAPGTPVVVTTGAHYVWIAVRNADAAHHLQDETVVRVDPRTYDQIPITVAAGVQNIAVGDGAVWVTNRASSTVTRIPTSTLRPDPTPFRVGRAPKGIAVDFGAVWVAAAGSRKLTRIDPHTRGTRSIALKAAPERVAVGGGSVWVTARASGQLLRVDPRKRRVVERIATGNDPYALDVSRATAVWLTLVEPNAVQRVRFYPRR